MGLKTSSTFSGAGKTDLQPISRRTRLGGGGASQTRTRGTFGLFSRGRVPYGWISDGFAQMHYVFRLLDTAIDMVRCSLGRAAASVDDPFVMRLRQMSRTRQALQPNKQEERKVARAVAAAGPWPVRLRFKTGHTSEDYVSRQAWREASLPRCPNHPRGGCSLARHGTCPRKSPAGTKIARWYCPESHTTFTLLPDCGGWRSRRRAWKLQRLCCVWTSSYLARCAGYAVGYSWCSAAWWCSLVVWRSPLCARRLPIGCRRLNLYA